jgi:redox-sensitive bicupin YhaK (pirin superfamily)
MNVWDLQLQPQASVELSAPNGWNTAIAVLHGELRVNAHEIGLEGQTVLLDRDGERFSLEATTYSMALILSGEPLVEPIVGHGPFVMTSQAEIAQAISDFNSGKFGRIN